MPVTPRLQWRGSVSQELQRERILDAVVAVVCEHGATGASVGLVLARAKVSRRMFYDCFAGLEDCLVAVIDRTLQQASALVLEAFAKQRLAQQEASAQQSSWLSGMRCALGAVLELLDCEPQLARVCIVEALGAGPLVLKQRERAVGEFRSLIVAQIDAEVSHASPLAAEGLLASVLGIVHARLIEPQPAPLIELLGPLMGLIAAPYLDHKELEREIQRGDQIAKEAIRRRSLHAADPAAPVRVPDVLLSARAHRARQCLLYVAEHPGASNQQVVAGIGASHREQVSRLLARLAALGLLVKRAGGPGHANAWSASAAGEQVALALAGATVTGETRSHYSEMSSDSVRHREPPMRHLDEVVRDT
jgi:AcrR family transcriptional regulator